MGMAEKLIPDSFEKCAEYVLVSKLAVARSSMTHYVTGL